MEEVEFARLLCTLLLLIAPTLFCVMLGACVHPSLTFGLSPALLDMFAAAAAEAALRAARRREGAEADSCSDCKERAGRGGEEVEVEEQVEVEEEEAEAEAADAVAIAVVVLSVIAAVCAVVAACV